MRSTPSQLRRRVSVLVVCSSLGGWALPGCSGTPAGSNGSGGNSSSVTPTGGVSGEQGGGGPAGAGGTLGSAGGSGAIGNIGGSGGAAAGGATGAGSTSPWPNCRPIFDGKTFDGWGGTHGWKITSDGAMASTGVGAQSYTTKSYRALRWIFSVQHKSGNHNPCTIVWGRNMNRGLSGI